MQQGKWQRKRKQPEEVEKTELAVVADGSGQTYRVSLRELVAGQHQTLLLYGKDGRLICDKPKLGRSNRQEVIQLTAIRRVVSPHGVVLRTVDSTAEML
jgi:hypothetical protein